MPDGASSVPLKSPVVVEILGIEVAEGVDAEPRSAPLLTVKSDPEALVDELPIPRTSMPQERYMRILLAIASFLQVPI